MSTQNPFADPNFGRSDAPVNGQHPASNPFSDPGFGKEPVAPRRSLLAAINDTVIEGANAAAGTASAVANFVRPGNSASQWVDKNIIEAGEAKQSEVVKAEKGRYSQEMQDAQGMSDEVGATLGYVARNPLLAAAQAAGSFAVPGLAIKGAAVGARALGLGAKGTTRAGLAAGAGVGAAGAGGDAAGTAYDLSREGGATDEQAVAAARGASVLPAAIGAAGGLVGAERLVAGAKGFGGGLVARALKTGAVEGAQEALEEGVTQYEGQRAAVPFNPDLDPMKGVAGAATMGGVLGTATGAGTSLLTGNPHARARKPSEDLGLDPSNGPLSKVAAAAVDAAASAQPQQGAAPDNGLSLQPVEQPQAPMVSSMAERLESLPQQARDQADQLLREIADERTPEGVKRFRANELQQLLDANPMPQAPSMDIPEEDRIAMRPIVRGFDPATGQAPAQPLEMADAQYQYEGGVEFEAGDPVQSDSAYQEAINRIALDSYQTPGQPMAMEQASRLRDAAQQQGIAATIVPHPSGSGFDVQATAALPESARSQVAQDPVAAALPYDNRVTGRMVADTQGNARPELRPEAVERDVRWNQERAQAAAEFQRREELGLSNTAQVTRRGQSTQVVPSITGKQIDGEWHAFAPESGTLGVPRAEMPQVFAEHRGALIGYLKGQGVESQSAEVNATDLKPTQAEFSVEKVRKAMDRKGGDRSILVSADGYVVDGHHQWLAKRQADQPVKVLQLQAPIAQLLPMVRSFPSARTAEGAQTDPTAQGQPNASPTLIDNALQAAAPSPTQSQAPAPALPQPTGVANVTEATQTQQAGAQPQAQADAATESEGQAPAATATKKVAASPVATQGIRDLAQRFRDRHAKSGADTDRTFAAVLDGFARDVDAGKRTMESVQPALERYQELAEKPLKTKQAQSEQEPDAIESDDAADATEAIQAPKSTPAAKQEAAPAPMQRIDDVGEKIGGARKDVWSGFRDDMGAVPDEAIAEQPLSKVWPQPDYQKLIEAGHDASTVAMVRSLRDAIPTKPRQSYKVKRWAEQVKELRAFALEMMDGQLPHQKLRTELLKAGSRDLRGIVGRAELYEAVGHSQSLEGISFAEHFYTLYKGKPNVTLWAVEQDDKSSTFGNWPRELATGDTKEQALEAFKKLYANQAKQEAKANVPSFDIWSMRRTGDIYVGKKIGRNYAELAGPFKTVREAREYRDQHLDELTSKLEKYKETPLERADINRPRVGQDMRQGLDVTPEQFREAFGFRGVEFGNWVEQGRRQQDLNDAFDALMDMAAILQLPPKAISLNGELGLAFGARGAGGKNPAAAHYERGKVVINLTKRSGAGSLGHEWWHAVDNYFARMRGQAGGMLTQASDVSVLSRGPAKTFAPNANVRQEMIQAFAEVIKAINNTSLRARAANLDSRRVKEYWGTDPELSARAFESYLIAKLEDQNASNDYLANVVDEKFWEVQAALGMQLENSYPYAKAGEVPVIRAAFDHFFSTVETKETDKGVAMFSRTERPAVSNTTAVQLRRAMVQRTVGSLTKSWGQSPNIMVVDSMKDARVPEAVRDADHAQRSQGATGEPEGFWYQGQVYLVASALPTSADVTRVLYHEVLGHHGLRGHFGKDLDRVLDQVAKLRPKDVATKAAEYGLDLGNPEHVRYASEEVLAELAQSRPDLGFVQRAIAAIRNFLRKHVPGMQAVALTDADIVQGYLLPARGWVERGGAVDSERMEPVFSRSQPADSIRSSMGSMTADQERAYLAVAGYDKVPTLRERFDQLRANLGLRMKQALVDQFAPIAQLDQNAYMLARMSKGSDGTLEAALLYGRPFLRDGVPDVDVKEGGFAKVLADLQGEHDRFLMYVAAQRAENLKAQGKENLFSDQDITSLKTLNDGQMPDGSSRKLAYAKALAQLNSFNESVLRMAKESGLIDQDAYELMRDQPYVPFYRLMEEESGLQGPSFSKGLTNQKAWKKLKGGTQQLNADLLQNMLLNWGNLYAASARNRAALATMDAANKMAVAYKVPSDTKGAAKVMRDGMTEHWMVEDPYLLEAISALNYQASPLMKPLAKAKQWLTIGVTVNPTFKVRNLIRDVVSSMAMADLSYNPASNVAKGWRLTARDSQVYASMLASGGVIKFGTQEQTDRARKEVAKLSGVMLDQNGAQKLWSQVKALYAVYDEFGDRTENINRAALYDRLIAKGHNHAEASFMARDLMDFSMGGSAPVVRFLTQSVPFLNARLQGLYKLGRSAKEDPRRFATVAMAVSMASLGLLAAYADDEDWKRREDWDRDSYWWFKIGETAYRIPKPFEVGAIGTLAERTAEAMFSEEMDSKRFMERISHMVSQTFAIDPVPQAFKPLLDIYANKDGFTGRAIESQADQRLRPEDRYNERTSEVARFLGQVGLPDPARLMKGEYAGLSPKQIDHLLRGYFSWMATASTVASDMLLRNTVVDRGESPSLRLKDVFLVGNFAEGLPSGSSRYVTAIYEQSKSVEQAYAAYRDALASGDHAKASEIMDSSGELIRSRGAVNTATKLLAQLNSQAKRVQADTNMNSDEKRERLTRIEQRRHEIAKRVMGSSVT